MTNNCGLGHSTRISCEEAARVIAERRARRANRHAHDFTRPPLKPKVYRDGWIWQWWCPLCGILGIKHGWTQPEAFQSALLHVQGLA